MRKWISGLLLGGLVTLFPLSAEAKVKVVATLPTLAAIAREVGGDAVEVTSLAGPNQDAHFVDARPNLALALNKADVLMVNGLELEAGWLPVLLTGSRNSRIQPGAAGYLDASSLVPLKQIPQQKIDRGMGDIHPGGNPHYLTDPRNGGRVAVGIAAKLASLDPANAAGFKRRANALKADAEAIASSQSKRFADLQVVERHVVTYHNSWIYFLDWLNLIAIGTIEPKPGISPDPGHVAWLLGHMRKVHADVIMQEAYYPTRIGSLLASKAQATLVVLPGGADFAGGQSYLDYVKELTDKTYAGVVKDTGR
ncbi:MAG TPA: metal ABC transporter substrate-binding protein [Pantanalinema sp.]